MFLPVALWWSVGDATGRGWSALIVVLVWTHADTALIALGEASDDARATTHTAYRDLRHDAVTDSSG